MDVGDLVPSFTLPDQSGAPWSLDAALESGPVVVFFFPAAMTTGCTKESCHFRDLGREFNELGAARVGISMDSVDRQRAFSDRYAFDFPLLSDESGAVSELFGVRRAFGPLRVRRRSFVIGPDHRVIRVVKSELHMQAHAEGALGSLKERAAR